MSLLPLGLISQGGGAGGSAAFELISTNILGSAAASVTFSSIPATYTHLQIRFTGRASSSGTSDTTLQFNGDTAANYGIHYLFGDGSSMASGSSATRADIRLGEVTNTSDSTGVFSVHIVDVLDYANTNKYKTARTLSGKNGTPSTGSGTHMKLYSGAWRSTAAISSLTLALSSGQNFVTGSRFSLYGIRGA